MSTIRIPLRPPHPERICWGCDKYCPADDLACGNGTIRTLHPCELLGDDWLEWSSSHGRPIGATGPDPASTNVDARTEREETT